MTITVLPSQAGSRPFISIVPGLLRSPLSHGAPKKKKKSQFQLRGSRQGESEHVGNFQPDLQAAKWVTGYKHPWICNDDHRARGLLDTFGMGFVRPSAPQIKFPEKEQLRNSLELCEAISLL